MKRFTRVLLRQFARAARPYLQSYGLLRTSKVFNTSSLVWEPGAESVMVLAPHMDDETIGCGGTLARHVRAGASVKVVFLTDGRHGGGSQLRALRGNARHAGEMELVATRKAEARQALGILGVQGMLFLDVEDGTLARDVARGHALARRFSRPSGPSSSMSRTSSNSILITTPPAAYCWRRPAALRCASSASATRCGRRCFPTASSRSMRWLSSSDAPWADTAASWRRLDYLHSGNGPQCLSLGRIQRTIPGGSPRRSVQFRCSDYRLMFETYAGSA